MNIKQHIEAGHYPKDEKGRALVPLSTGGAATIYDTDLAGGFCICGRIDGVGGGVAFWTEDGDRQNRDWPSLLPPPLRRVAITRWLISSHKRTGTPEIVFKSREQVDQWGPLAGDVVVELSGEYEEPWE